MLLREYPPGAYPPSIHPTVLGIHMGLYGPHLYQLDLEFRC